MPGTQRVSKYLELIKERHAMKASGCSVTEKIQLSKKLTVIACTIYKAFLLIIFLFTHTTL